MQQRVDQRREGLRPSKQRRTLGEEGQHSGTQIPVEGKGHVCRAEGGLEDGGKHGVFSLQATHNISRQFVKKTNLSERTVMKE